MEKWFIIYHRKDGKVDIKFFDSYTESYYYEREYIRPHPDIYRYYQEEYLLQPDGHYSKINEINFDFE